MPRSKSPHVKSTRDIGTGPKPTTRESKLREVLAREGYHDLATAEWGQIKWGDYTCAGHEFDFRGSVLRVKLPNGEIKEHSSWL